MKKMIILLALFMAGLQFTVRSQEARVGAVGGFVMSDVRGTINEMNHKIKTGFTFGILMDVPISSRFTFQPGLNYVQKGNIRKENSREKITVALRYAELPLNFLYNFGTNMQGLYVGAGPSIAFNVPSKIITRNRAGKEAVTDVLFGETIENDFRGVDYGVNFQLGYKLSSGVFFSTYYNHGLRNLKTGENTGGEAKNACFGIQLGFLVNNK